MYTIWRFTAGWRAGKPLKPRDYQPLDKCKILFISTQPWKPCPFGVGRGRALFVTTRLSGTTNSSVNHTSGRVSSTPVSRWPALERRPRSCSLYEDAPHCLGRGYEEVSAAVPMLSLVRREPWVGESAPVFRELISGRPDGATHRRPVAGARLRRASFPAREGSGFELPRSYR